MLARRIKDESAGRVCLTRALNCADAALALPRGASETRRRSTGSVGSQNRGVIVGVVVAVVVAEVVVVAVVVSVVVALVVAVNVGVLVRVVTEAVVVGDVVGVVEHGTEPDAGTIFWNRRLIVSAEKLAKQGMIIAALSVSIWLRTGNTFAFAEGSGPTPITMRVMARSSGGACTHVDLPVSSSVRA